MGKFSYIIISFVTFCQVYYMKMKSPVNYIINEEGYERDIPSSEDSTYYKIIVSLNKEFFKFNPICIQFVFKVFTLLLKTLQVTVFFYIRFIYY